MSSTETYDRNQQSQYLNVNLENNTKHPFGIPTAILRCIELPHKSYELHFSPQPHTVYKSYQFTQKNLSKKYPDTYEVNDENSAIADDPSDFVPINDVTRVSIIPLPEVSPQKIELFVSCNCCVNFKMFTNKINMSLASYIYLFKSQTS